jgi:molybdopterin converting factor small subunit
MVRVLIPLLLTDVSDGAREAQVQGETLAEVVAALDEIHPGIAARIHRDGRLNPNVAITVDGKFAVRGLDTPVGLDAEVNLLPAFGGG